MSKILKSEVSKYNTPDFESVNLELELGGQLIQVSIQAIDGKLRVLTGPLGTNIAPLTYPVNQSIDNFGYPEG